MVWGRLEIGVGAIGAVLSFVIVFAALPPRKPEPKEGPQGAFLDFRPVLRNTSALA